MKALVAARNSADLSPSSPEMVLQQAEKQGIAAVSDAEWRRNRVEQRKQQAQAGFREAVLHMSAVAAEYYTPEEKLAFAQLLDSSRANAPQDEVVSIWIPAAMTAGLKDREAQWRKDVLFSEKTFDNGKLDAFNLLEKQRMENTSAAKRWRNTPRYTSSQKPIRFSPWPKAPGETRGTTLSRIGSSAQDGPSKQAAS